MPILAGAPTVPHIDSNKFKVIATNFVLTLQPLKIGIDIGLFQSTWIKHNFTIYFMKHKLNALLTMAWHRIDGTKFKMKIMLTTDQEGTYFYETGHIWNWFITIWDYYEYECLQWKFKWWANHPLPAILYVGYE